MHDIDTKISRAHTTQHGVHVGPVAINLAPNCVNPLCDLDDPLLEKTQRCWQGQHQRCNIVVQLCLKLTQVDIAVLPSAKIHHLKTSHLGRCRIGAMGRVRNEHFVATPALLVQPLLDAKQSSHFTLGSSGWLCGN